MDPGHAERLIRSYVDGWRAGDVEGVLASLSSDCTIIESHGPTYQGRDLVRAWMTSWFGAGQAITAWRVTSLFAAGGMAAFEWVFTCTGDWGEATFDGATVVRFRDGRIGYLREYRCTEPPFPWSPPDSSQTSL